MTNNTKNADVFSVIPKDPEAREVFAKTVNEIIDSVYRLKAEQDLQKAKIVGLFELSGLDVKKGDYAKRIKLLVKEHLEAKASEDNRVSEDVIGDYSIIGAKLK